MISKKSERVTIKQTETLSKNWGTLQKITFDYQYRDGSRQEQTREIYDRGDGVVILLYNLRRRSVVLIRQFRLVVYLNDRQGLLIEAPAGLLDGATPDERIKAETEEETGYHLSHVRKIAEIYMSPGSVSEKLHFYIAEYEDAFKKGAGGGMKEDGEDIEILEMPFQEAMGKVASGEIADAKTILLLQYAALHLFTPATAFSR